SSGRLPYVDYRCRRSPHEARGCAEVSAARLRCRRAGAARYGRTRSRHEARSAANPQAFRDRSFKAIRPPRRSAPPHRVGLRGLANSSKKHARRHNERLGLANSSKKHARRHITRLALPWGQLDLPRNGVKDGQGGVEEQTGGGPDEGEGEGGEVT